MKIACANYSPKHQLQIVQIQSEDRLRLKPKYCIDPKLTLKNKNEKWSQKKTESKAPDLEKSVFAFKDSKKIAKSLKIN
jgi:hypothetical protein